MLASVAVACVLLVSLVAADGITSLVLLLAMLAVGAHVSSTVLGGRLRDHADRLRAWEAMQNPARAAGPLSTLVWAPRPTESPLYGRRSSLRRLPSLVAAGALIGTVAGAVLLSASIGHRTSTAGIAVGATSLGVVGGWIAFLGTSFWTILRQGWREAVAHQKQDEARRRARR